MAQHDYVIANGTGSAVRSDLNNALAAIVSQNSGATTPATTYAFQLWADTTTNTLKLRNSANSAWIELRQLDGDFTTVSVDNGTAAAPSIYFNASGTDTGIYSSGTDALDFSTAGTRRLGIASGGDLTVYSGNVTLNAQGDLRFADSDSSNWVAFQSPATVSSNVTWTLPSADGTNGQALTTNGSGTLSWTSPTSTTDKITEGNTEAEVVDTGSDGHFKVTTEGTERLRIDSSGRCGIGTTSPARLLHVSSLSSDGHIAVEAGTSNAAFIDFRINGTNKHYVGSASLLGSGTNDSMTVWNSANGYMNFGTNGTERARIDSSGRLLVGTSTSRGNGSLLQVVDDASNNPAQFFCSPNNSEGPNVFWLKARGGSTGSPSIVSSGDTLGRMRFSGYDGSTYTEAASIVAQVDGTPGANDMPGRLVFSTTKDGNSSPTERIRLDNSGVMRHLSDAPSGGSGYVVLHTQSASTSTFLIQGVHSATTVLNGTVSFRVFTNGNVENTNNSYAGISDIKLKENIVDANSQWDDLKALQVRNYNFKEETGHQTHTQIGLIAQEAELVSPGLIYESPDRDEDGNDLGTVTKSVNYSVLYMKAVKALQEAMERIETLEAKVAALESA